MKFEKFRGTADAGKRSDFRDEPKHVAASEASKRDASGAPDRNSLQAAVSQCEAEHTAKKERLLAIELRLGQIRRAIGGVTLPAADYRRFCDEQDALNEEKAAVVFEGKRLKLRLTELQRDLHQAEKVNTLETTNRLLESILAELRRIARLLSPAKAE
jgi:hypothetical protein